jgi:MFS family permease
MRPATSNRNDWIGDDPALRHNLHAESLFSAFNGVFMGMALVVAPIVAVTGVEANALELTILVSAFPAGAFLGPLWAALGRRWGMQKLVTQMAFWANVPLLLMLFVQDAVLFTGLIAVSQLLNSAMRMGQSSLYRIMYPRGLRGRVLGRLTFWTFLTMVPTVLVTGALVDLNRDGYRLLYPLAGLCGLVGCYFYRRLRVPAVAVRHRSLRSGVRGVQRILAEDRAYLLFQFAFFLSGSAFFMSTHVVLLQVRERFKFGALELSLWLTVVPQLLLALGSPAWGRILDRFGIVRCRLLISVIMTAYLGSYWAGILTGLPWLICLGSMLQGMSNGGGQLTWSLASSHFAPRADDIPLYNGIHFVLNGVRGLAVPWLGSGLLVLAGGPWAVLAAGLVSMASIPVILRSLRLGDGPAEEPVLAGAELKKASPSTG